MYIIMYNVNLKYPFSEATVLSAPCSPSNLSSVTLVASSPSDSNNAHEVGGSVSPRSPSHPKETPIVKEPPPVVREKAPKGDVQRKTSAAKHEGPVDKRLERCISEDSEGEPSEFFVFLEKLHGYFKLLFQKRKNIRLYFIVRCIERRLVLLDLQVIPLLPVQPYT